tara:strand:+ start:155 stop:385 length:231 start_codon:yes stop_codon:yes gene_type:complete
VTILEEKCKLLEKLIIRAKKVLYSKKISKPTIKTGASFSSLNEYRLATGKRFRRTRRELDLGLTQEEAFRERYPRK